MMKLIATSLMIMSTITAYSKDIAADSLLGVITFRKGFDYSKDSIYVYNADGSPWFWYTSDGVDHGPGAYDFQPIVFYPDYSRFCVRVMSIKGNRYEIIANEATGLKKYIVINKNSKLEFMTAQAYLKTHPAIVFDWYTNPLRKTIDGDPVKFNYEMYDVRFLGFRGDWANVKVCENDTHFVEGWVRWRKDNRLLIQVVKD